MGENLDSIQLAYEQEYKISLDDFQLSLAEEVLRKLSSTGQAALEVMTSGGKSYIAAYIIREYLNKHVTGRVLWLGPKSAVENVRKKIFSKTALRNRIEYRGYEEISRGNTLIEDPDDIKLVVFDECHRAYANKTFEYLEEILDQLDYTDRLAMSATPVRYSGVNTFHALVPNVSDIVRFNIEDASKHNLLPNVVYVLANMAVSKRDLKALDKYKKLVANNVEAMELYSQVFETMTNFKFNLQEDLGKLLENNIKHTETDGVMDGERHIAFFSNIAVLRSMKAGIEAAFQQAYPKCDVVVYEYHSDMPNNELMEIFNKFVGEDPVPNRIEVMLSVNKANESIHPDNIRSVLMFRDTQSVRIYLQQMGRGLMLKAYHPEDIVIFDFSDNISCLGSQSIYVGNREIDKRGGLRDNPGDTLEDIKRALREQFGYTKGFEAKIGIERLNKCVSRLNRLYETETIRGLSRDIKRLRNGYANMVKNGFCAETNNFYTLVSNIIQEIETDTMQGRIWKEIEPGEATVNELKRVLTDFKAYQDTFIAPGNHCSKLVASIFTKLGHMGYLRQHSGNMTELALDKVDYIKQAYEQSEEPGKLTNNHAKHKIKELRIDMLRKNIGSEVAVYAKRNGIDIQINDITYEEICKICETPEEADTAKAFKPIVNICEQITRDIEKGGVLEFDEWLNLYIKMLVTYKRAPNNEITYMCVSMLYSQYGEVLGAFKPNQRANEETYKLISILLKDERGENFSTSEEDFIFSSLSEDNYTPYEENVIKEFGLKTSVKKQFTRLSNSTEFSKAYVKAKQGDEEAIMKMLAYNRDKLDTVRKKKLNTDEFRSIKKNTKETLGAEILLKKAKVMCEDGEEYAQLIRELDEALTNETIQQLDLALTPFKQSDIKHAKQVLDSLDDEFNGWQENIAIVSPLNILVTRCSQRISCSKQVIGNLIKIPSLDEKYKARLEALYNLV